LNTSNKAKRTTASKALLGVASIKHSLQTLHQSDDFQNEPLHPKEKHGDQLHVFGGWSIVPI
jgi:hypothetical protein